MPVELRKRPAPKEAPAPAAKRSNSKPRATAKAKGVVSKVRAAVTGDSSTNDAAATPAVPDSETTGDTGMIPETVGAGTSGSAVGAEAPAATTAPSSEAAPTTEPPAASTTTTTAAAVGATTPLDGSSPGKTIPSAALSTSIQTHDGTSTTLGAILSASSTGVVIFTYPKASTPGCTTQACLFRDNYDSITAQGYAVYGLSNDSEKANTGFKTKQNLQYTMLCDPDAKLTAVLGMKKPGPAKGTLRGVVVIGKDGDVRVWFQGGPPKTLDAVKTFLAA